MNTTPITLNAYLARAAAIYAKLARLQQLADKHSGHDPDSWLDHRDWRRPPADGRRIHHHWSAATVPAAANRRLPGTRWCSALSPRHQASKGVGRIAESRRCDDLPVDVLHGLATAHDPGRVVGDGEQEARAQRGVHQGRRWRTDLSHRLTGDCAKGVH